MKGLSSQIEENLRRKTIVGAPPLPYHASVEDLAIIARCKEKASAVLLGRGKGGYHIRESRWRLSFDETYCPVRATSHVATLQENTWIIMLVSVGTMHQVPYRYHAPGTIHVPYTRQHTGTIHQAAYRMTPPGKGRHDHRTPG